MQTQEQGTVCHTPVSQEEWQPMERVNLNGVSPSYLPLVWTESLIASLLVLSIVTAVLAFIVQLPATILTLVLTGVLLLVITSCMVRSAQAKCLAYGLTPQELLLQKGLIWRKRTSLPYSRIQHVSLSQGPLERYFGLKQLKCFSAGSGSAEIHLRGLEAATAEHIRQNLLSKAGSRIHPQATSVTENSQSESDHA